MKKLFIILIILLGCSDPEVEPDKDDVFYPCNIESTPLYFKEIEPDDVEIKSKGHIVYIYYCVPYHDSANMRSVLMTWKFDGCWAYTVDVDKCI